jgi:hypothetical protein
MKTKAHLSSYLAELFLKFKMFQTKLPEKIKTHIYVQQLFFSENRAVCEII